MKEQDDVTTRDHLAEVPTGDSNLPRGMKKLKAYKLICPKCKFELQATPDLVGAEVDCPICAQTMNLVVEDAMGKNVTQAEKLLHLIEGTEMPPDTGKEGASIDAMQAVLNNKFGTEIGVANATFDYDRYELTVQLTTGLPNTGGSLNTELASIFGVAPNKVNVVDNVVTVKDLQGEWLDPDGVEDTELEIVGMEEGVLFDDDDTYMFIEDCTVEELEEADEIDFDDTSSDEAMVRVVRGGKVISKKVRVGRKKRISSGTRRKMSMASKKAWKGGGKTQRMKSMKKSLKLRRSRGM